MIKGIIDSFELWQSRPEYLNDNMEDPIKSAEHRGWNKCNNEWLNIVKEQPRVGEWIPCSERLPEEGQTVLIQYVDRKDKEDITIAVGWMNGVLYSWDDRITGNPDAVAWMPLPEPYKEETK